MDSRLGLDTSERRILSPYLESNHGPSDVTTPTKTSQLTVIWP